MFKTEVLSLNSYKNKKSNRRPVFVLWTVWNEHKCIFLSGSYSHSLGGRGKAPSLGEVVSFA